MLATGLGVHRQLVQMFVNRVVFYRYISVEFLLTGSGGFSGSSIIPVTVLNSFGGGVKNLGSEALLS